MMNVTDIIDRYLLFDGRQWIGKQCEYSDMHFGKHITYCDPVADSSYGFFNATYDILLGLCYLFILAFGFSFIFTIVWRLYGIAISMGVDFANYLMGSKTIKKYTESDF